MPMPKALLFFINWDVEIIIIYFNLFYFIFFYLFIFFLKSANAAMHGSQSGSEPVNMPVLVRSGK